MSLYGSLFSGVSALSAQSQSMGMISDNIANVNTVGYKRTDASFSSLVTRSGRSTAYSPGTVRAQAEAKIDEQGGIQQSNSTTDIAMSGSGFFVVNQGLEGPQETLYTRAGQFSEDRQGFLRNTAGFYLMGWPLDENGNIPPNSADDSSLEPVDVAFLGGITRPTTQIDLGFNLDATDVSNTYPVAASAEPQFSRGLTVYDTLGNAQDVLLEFNKHTSPTATKAGTRDVTDVGSIFDEVPQINSTATYTGDVDLTAAGTYDSLTTPAIANADSFIMEFNGEERIINITDATAATNDPTDGLVALINAQFAGTPASLDGAGQLEINADTPIEIRQGGTQPLNQSQLQALGLTVDSGFGDGLAVRDPRTFTIEIQPSGVVQTVEINEGDTINDLVNEVNGLTGINAQINAEGEIIIAADNFGDDLIFDNIGGGGNQISQNGFEAGLGFPAATYPDTVTAPPPPSLYNTLENAANPLGWWELTVRAPDGSELRTASLNFNGDGTLNAVEGDFDITGIDWGNGSDIQDLNFDISAFTQFAGDSSVAFTDQNGAELGLRTGVEINEDGVVIARFSNGEQAELYKLPIATFANPNGLGAQNGNVYSQSDESGEFNLREAGRGGAGTVEASSLEGSNVDLADEFSKMIITQRAYSAGTKVINTSDEMLQELLRLR